MWLQNQERERKRKKRTSEIMNLNLPPDKKYALNLNFHIFYSREKSFTINNLLKFLTGTVFVDELCVFLLLYPMIKLWLLVLFLVL